MIILKHLTVERFRLLRELNLHFPQRGSILIQGPNEAGKSALLESIYFALYGESLASDRGQRSLDDLVLYGATNATVTLTLSIGATEMTIVRSIERGKGQKVTLYVHRLGMPEEEPITRLGAVNECIINELGMLDGPTLRNSCLIEQKGLERLEHLSGAEREISARKILGLEKLTRLTEHFKVTPDDERQLEESRERLRLAEMQARIPELSKQLEQIEAALDAVRVIEDLQEIDQQEADIAEQEQTLVQIQATRLELKGRQGRIQQLKKADATLEEIIAAYDGIAEARREIPELEKQIAELERREREELPILEKRVGDLSELTRSFGTLQRMSNDLLTAVDTIKDLEQELRQHDEVKDHLKSLDEQVAHARAQLAQAQQALHDLEERRRAGRPQLEARLQRMKTLSDRLSVLRQVEEQYFARVKSKERCEENKAQQLKVQKDLRETEQEMELVEAEARQVQKQAEALEQRWRQLAIRRQIEEWQRLSGLARGLAEAEQHVRLAYQHQEKLNLAAMEARGASRKHMMIGATCVVLFVALAITALVLFSHSPIIAAIAGIAALILAGVGGVSFQNYGKAREEEKIADQQMQEAINRVGMMVAARETAMRMGGNQEALEQVEHEIRALGGNIPHTIEEAQAFLQRVSDQGESLADLQKRMKEKLDEANAARSQVSVTMEAVAALRKERARLDEQYRQEDWDHIDEHLSADQATVERMQQEITLLAGQEGLPLPSINERLQNTPSGPLAQIPAASSSDESSGIPELESLVESTIKATEREIAALDGKLDLVTDLAAQVKIHQEALNVLLTRQRVIEERNARYQTSNPALQIERAREQQAGLRHALQALQDSLRQRVKPLGVAFGQAAINHAETVARKQLEELHITLGNRLMLQERHADYLTRLKEHQESLGDYYKQLAKFSNSLGSWIVPLNPFAEALAALRTRCQRELEEADEMGILKALDRLRDQEGAAKAKIELCRQEIESAHERIAAMLVQRNRPATKNYTRSDIATVWPLVNEHSLEDRPRLKEERTRLEQELTDLEEQELALSKQLQTGSAPIALRPARQRLELQERAYQTKKRGNLLVKAVNERLMRKMLPRTEYYMQQILPLLTGGRYHDVHLTTETEEGTVSGGPFQLRIWDPAASEYVPRSALSGGAADQLSLALRLAFTIAALPRELNAAPGFVMLDEPLSSFDRGRTQALVDVVTGESLGQHFEQIILVSHSSAFDPALFPYHIYMDNGVVVESNLPVVPELSAAEMNRKDDSPVRVTVVPAHVGVESGALKA
jgi:DNA repair exonuclease SbcCD ATPase subunit